MTNQNYPTTQIIAWLTHDPHVLAVAQYVIKEENESGERPLPEWMRCRLGLCGISHADSDIPGRAIPSLHELQHLISPEQFEEIDWDIVRNEIREKG